VPEKYGRKRRRSKFGMYRMPEFLKPKKEVLQVIEQEQKQRIRKINR